MRWGSGRCHFILVGWLHRRSPWGYRQSCLRSKDLDVIMTSSFDGHLIIWDVSRGAATRRLLCMHAHVNDDPLPRSLMVPLSGDAPGKSQMSRCGDGCGCVPWQMGTWSRRALAHWP